MKKEVSVQVNSSTLEVYIQTENFMNEKEVMTDGFVEFIPQNDFNLPSRRKSSEKKSRSSFKKKKSSSRKKLY